MDKKKGARGGGPADAALHTPPRRDYDPAMLEQARRSQTPVSLDYSFVKFTNAQLSDLCLALERGNTITKLNLSACNLGEQMIPILKSLEGNTCLTAIDLTYNNPPKGVLKALDKLLSTNFTIQSISMKSPSSDPLSSKDSEWILQSLVDNTGVAKFISGDTSYLRLSGRKIDRFPVWLLKFSHVTQLNLHQNNLSSLPSEIKRMVNLLKMNVSANQLTSVPKEIGQLSKLQYCDLSSNQLSSLPEAAVNLSELQFLDLSSNKFKRLQPFLGNMEKLQKLVTGNNPISNIPREFLESGNTQDIKKHLRDTEGSVRANRMKLMLVGKENVGKTSLIRALMKSGAASERSRNPLMNVVVGLARRDSSATKLSQPNDDDPNLATDGIAISDWAVPNSNLANSNNSHANNSNASNSELTFCTYDFAGQEVYYVSHQFFLSRRALYIVTFNLLEGLRFLDKIEYWFQSIRMRAPNSQIVLVGTHIDDPRCTDEYISKVFREITIRLNLQKRGFHLAKQFAVSCKTGAGIDELRDALIELAGKDPAVQEKIPRAYLSLEQKLRALVLSKAISPPLMSWSEFKQLANECGLSDRSVMSAAQFLNDVGSLVYFHEPDTSLHDMVILDPQWVTDLLASIVTLKHNLIKDGIIKHSDLRLLWKFNTDLHPRLLKLLERFEISYPLPVEGPEGPKSLVPCLLPEQRPAFDLVWNKRDFEIQYNRRYELQHAPRGLFSRFMIRLLHFANGVVYWQNGILLTDGGSKALVELHHVNALTKDLVVLVRGNTKNAKFLLRIIVETLESLMRSWFQVPYTQTIACPMCIDDPTRDSDPYPFPFDECSLRFSSGSSEPMLCKQDNTHKVPIERLVPDVALADFHGTLVSSSDIELNEHIATGPFSRVYRAFWNDTEVAVKEIQLYSIENVEEKLSTFCNFRHEVWVMSGISHPNIVTLLAFAVNPFLIVMEWVPLGDLYKHLHNDQLSKALTWPARVRVAIDVAMGMAFLHSAVPPVLHRDLKSPNIFLMDTYHGAPVVAKVADFGLSSRLFINELKERSKKRAVELPTWLAPEVLSELPYTEKSDIYAFGVVMWELYTGEHPFQEFTFKYQHQLEEAIKCGTRPIIPGNCPPAWGALVTRCWDNSPARRPAFAEILSELQTYQQQMLYVSSANNPFATIGPATGAAVVNLTGPKPVVPSLATVLNTSTSPDDGNPFNLPAPVSPQRSPQPQMQQRSPLMSPHLQKSPTSISPLMASSHASPSPELFSFGSSPSTSSPANQTPLNSSPARPGSGPAVVAPAPMLMHSASAPSLDTRVRRDTVFVNGSLEKKIQLPGHNNNSSKCTAMFVVGESLVLVGSAEGHLFLYSASNGELLDRSDSAHSSAVTSFVSTGTEVWSAGEDGVVNMWEIKKGARSPRYIGRTPSASSGLVSSSSSSSTAATNLISSSSNAATGTGGVLTGDACPVVIGRTGSPAQSSKSGLRNSSITMLDNESDTQFSSAPTANSSTPVITGLMNIFDPEKKKKKLRSITLTDATMFLQERKNPMAAASPLLGRRFSSQALGIDLRGAKVDAVNSVEEKDFAFTLTSKSDPSHPTIFFVDSEELRNKWVSNIRDRIDALKEASLVLLQRRKMPRVIQSMLSVDDDVWLGARDHASVSVWTSKGAAPKRDINVNFESLRRSTATNPFLSNTSTTAATSTTQGTVPSVASPLSANLDSAAVVAPKPYPSFASSTSVQAVSNRYPSFSSLSSLPATTPNDPPHSSSGGASNSAASSSGTSPFQHNPMPHHKAPPVAWDIRPRSNSLARNSPTIGVGMAPSASSPPVRSPTSLSNTGAPVSLGTVHALFAHDENIWCAMDRHLVLLARKGDLPTTNSPSGTVMRMLEDRHESPVKQIILVSSESIWTGSYDRLCMWNTAGDLLRELDRVSCSLPPVRCLLSLGEFVWIAGEPATTSARSSNSPGIQKSALQIWSLEGRMVKVVDSPHTGVISSLVKVGERCCWSGAQDGYLCVWV